MTIFSRPLVDLKDIVEGKRVRHIIQGPDYHKVGRLANVAITSNGMSAFDVLDESTGALLGGTRWYVVGAFEIVGLLFHEIQSNLPVKYIEHDPFYGYTGYIQSVSWGPLAGDVEFTVSLDGGNASLSCKDPLAFEPDIRAVPDLDFDPAPITKRSPSPPAQPVSYTTGEWEEVAMAASSERKPCPRHYYGEGDCNCGKADPPRRPLIR